MCKIILVSAVLAFSIVFPAGATMSESEGWNLGSIMAAAIRCESEGLMNPGKTAPFIRDVQSKLSDDQWESVKTGYLQGLKKRGVYSFNHNGWASMPDQLDRDTCSFIEFALEQIMIIYGYSR